MVFCPFKLNNKSPLSLKLYSYGVKIQNVEKLFIYAIAIGYFFSINCKLFTAQTFGICNFYYRID